MLFLSMALLSGCTEVATAPGNGTIIPTHGQAMVHSQGTRIVDADDQPLLLRCTNIDGWLQPIPYLISDSGDALFVSPTEFAGALDDVVGAPAAAAFWRDYRDRFITEADFQRMAELGFNCARLPLYHRFADTDALDRVQQALDWGLAYNVYVVLDLHSVPGGQNTLPTVSDVPSNDAVARLWEGPDAVANQDATVALWSSLATRFAGHPALAGYDLQNEPHVPAGVAPGALPALYERIAVAVRAADPLHMLFVEGDALAHDFSAFTGPADANMAYSFHAYALTGFEYWATVDPADIQEVVALRSAHDRPLWLGEFGEQTIDWQVDVIELVEGQEIGWAVYPWKRKQTLFFNPVVQRIPDMPQWYVVASFLAQGADGTRPVPSAAEAEAGMAELLDAISLERCIEDGAAANRLFGR